MRSFRALPTALLAFFAAATPSFAQDVEEDSGEPPKDLQVEITNHVFCSHPSAKGDTVKVHYSLSVFGSDDVIESSFDKKPFTFMVGLGQVIKGWDQGMLNMCPGETRTLTIPPGLAYGSTGTGDIPEDSTLVFQTEMLAIYGHKQKSISTWYPVPTMMAINQTMTQTNGSLYTAQTTVETVVATAPPTPAWPIPGAVIPTGTAFDSADRVAGGQSPKEQAEAEENQCKLLGPFALLVQGALGVLALLTLVFKRYRESPKRPWRVWFFDVAKQVTGSVILHLINLLMSELGAGNLENKVAEVGSQVQDEEGRKPNPCSFYLLNLAIDVSHSALQCDHTCKLTSLADYHRHSRPLRLPQGPPQGLPSHTNRETRRIHPLW